VIGTAQATSACGCPRLIAPPERSVEERGQQDVDFAPLFTTQPASLKPRLIHLPERMTIQHTA
jgi:hypothetical protein